MSAIVFAISKGEEIVLLLTFKKRNTAIIINTRDLFNFSPEFFCCGGTSYTRDILHPRFSLTGTGQFDANVSTPTVRRQRFDAWSVRRRTFRRRGSSTPTVRRHIFFFRIFIYF